MSRWIEVNELTNRYITEHLPPEHPVLQALHKETAVMQGARMQISHEQACFMSTVLRSMGAQRTIEVGVYTGYSTLVTALALPPNGQVIACDINAEWTAIARRYWEQAGVASRIELCLAPAAETMSSLLEKGQAEQFDFVFIDADKTAYDNYYELALKLLRPGGLIMLDNCLWGGAVLDATDQDEDTQAIRRLNDKIAADKRVSVSLVPIGDGIFLASKTT